MALWQVFFFCVNARSRFAHILVLLRSLSMLVSQFVLVLFTTRDSTRMATVTASAEWATGATDVDFSLDDNSDEIVASLLRSLQRDKGGADAGAHGSRAHFDAPRSDPVPAAVPAAPAAVPVAPAAVPAPAQMKDCVLKI